MATPLSTTNAKSERMGPTRWLLGAALLLALGIPVGVALLALSASETGTTALRGGRVLSAGMPAPDFHRPAQDGRVFHLADYKGRAVFVVFLPDVDSTDSRNELRSLKATAGDFDRAGAKVLAVAPVDAAAATAVHDSEALPFPILTDPDGSLRAAYTIPAGRRTTFVVAPDGNVKYRVGNTIVEPATHGKQLIDISKCCVDELLAARAGGIGKPVGDFSLPRADSGAMETLFGDSPAKATVVLFISAKCPCANGYNDRMRNLAAEYGGKGVRFVAVYSNSDESPAQVAKHAKEQKFPFPALTDERGLCADHFHATVTPQVFVLDANKILRYAGRIDDNRKPTQVKTHDLRLSLDAILAGSAVPAETRPFGCAIVRDTRP